MALTPAELLRLDAAVRPIQESVKAAYGCYLVGSATERPDYRDVDVRMIMPAKAFKRLTLNSPHVHRLLNVAFSQMVDAAAGLRRPVDFQIQSQAESTTMPGATYRHPLGSRWRHDPPFADAAHASPAVLGLRKIEPEPKEQQ